VVLRTRVQPRQWKLDTFTSPLVFAKKHPSP
jgi:hypothetical protein